MKMTLELVLENCFLVDFPYINEQEASKKLQNIKTEEERMRRVVEDNKTTENRADFHRDAGDGNSAFAIQLRMKRIKKVEGLEKLHAKLPHIVRQMGFKEDEPIDQLDPSRCHVAVLNLSLNRISKLINIHPIASQLQVLDLSRNMIDGNKANLTQLSLCTNLRELILSQNQLEGIPESVRVLVNLLILDLSMNKIKDIQHLDHSKKLQKLILFGNQIETITGLEKLQLLREIELQRNQISNADGIGLLAGSEVHVVNLADNKLESLSRLKASLQALDSLSHLHLQNNPVAANSDYRVTVLAACPHLLMLDNEDVKPYTKNQWNTVHKAHSVEEGIESLIVSLTNEYEGRDEMSRKNTIIDSLRMQERLVEETFTEYKDQMTSELDNTVKFIRNAAQKGESWTTDPGALKKWLTELHSLEKERKKLLREEEKQRENAKADAMFLKAKMLSFQGKLYEISMKKPEIWRKMKERELKIARREEHGTDLRGGVALGGEVATKDSAHIVARREVIPGGVALNKRAAPDTQLLVKAADARTLVAHEHIARSLFEEKDAGRLKPSTAPTQASRFPPVGN